MRVRVICLSFRPLIVKVHVKTKDFCWVLCGYMHVIYTEYSHLSSEYQMCTVTWIRMPLLFKWIFLFYVKWSNFMKDLQGFVWNLVFKHTTITINVEIIQLLIYFCTALSFKEKENWLNLLKISLIVEILWTATMRKIIRYSILYHQAVVCNFFCSLSDWYRKPYQLRRIFTVIQSLATPPPINRLLI